MVCNRSCWLCLRGQQNILIGWDEASECGKDSYPKKMEYGVDMVYVELGLEIFFIEVWYYYIVVGGGENMIYVDE